jgi:hypothetical protein
MADLSNIDIPSMVTALLTILVAVGGILGKTYISKALGGLALVADVLVDVSGLMIAISKAGADGTLTPEEWTLIKEDAREVQAHLIAIQGKFGTILS